MMKNISFALNVILNGHLSVFIGLTASNHTITVTSNSTVLKAAQKVISFLYLVVIWMYYRLSCIIDVTYIVIITIVILPTKLNYINLNHCLTVNAMVVGSVPARSRGSNCDVELCHSRRMILTLPGFLCLPWN